MPPIIAIDGPAAAGKGTLAKALARQLNFAYLDTGLLYRCVGVKAAEQKMLTDATVIAQGLEPPDLNRTDLRTPAAGSHAAKVAGQPGVRQALFNFQHHFGLNPPEGKAGAILDGRDIGTVIFPDADFKFYISASPQARAQRRYDELPPESRPSLSEILMQIKERDARDATREEAPMRAARDAHLIDTSHLDRDQVFHLALSIIQKGS